MGNQASMKEKFRIGFVDEDAYDEYHNLLAKGVYDSAYYRHMDVIRFSHFHCEDTRTNPYQEEVYIELIRQFKLDGLIFLGWERTTNNGELFNRLKNMPLVSVGAYYSGVSSVYFMGRSFVVEIIKHLINVHGMKKIAYIAPIRPDDRTDVFFEVMDRYNIYDPQLFISSDDLPGLDRRERGRRAVEILLDERKIFPEAIVSLYNEETFEIVNALQSRGIRVPDEIAVTSYEDGETGKFSTPAFTTVYFPWKELGYYACEAMYTLLTKGGVQRNIRVPGKVIYRSSCGCVPQSATSMDIRDIPYSAQRFGELNDAEIEKIIDNIDKLTPFDKNQVNELLGLFREAFLKGEYNSFLKEFEIKLRMVQFYDEVSEFQQIATVFRKELMPYFLSYTNKSMNEVAWADNMFQQMQIILQTRLANTWFQKDVEYNNLKLALKKVGEILITNFDVESLFNTLESNLLMLDIKSCWLYLFGEDNDRNPFTDYHPEFIFVNGKRVKASKEDGKNGFLCPEDIRFSDDKCHFLLVQLLYQGDQFMGFCVFESSLKDLRITRSLSGLISIALNSTILFNKLEQSYRVLMEKAHKKGMLDTTAILHNIANIMNSVSVTYHTLVGLVEDSCVNDLTKANDMLEENFQQLDEFIERDPKGRLLMQYYVSFIDSFKAFQARLNEYVERMIDKTGLVEDIINTQQSFEGIRSNLEHLDVVPVIEDALKVNRGIIASNEVRLVKKINRSVKAMAHKTKLLHILINIIKNAVESMQYGQNNEKVLTIEVTSAPNSVYIRISDTGHGIEEEKLEDIFAYGFTTKSTGHGFGLHSCANYMTEMQGRIWAEKAKTGTGAVFVMQFRSQSSL